MVPAASATSCTGPAAGSERLGNETACTRLPRPYPTGVLHYRAEYSHAPVWTSCVEIKTVSMVLVALSSLAIVGARRASREHAVMPDHQHVPDRRSHDAPFR